eukprot:CAMPEP_0174243474 /NCGR_PEP_ID=MMETSP0417-20130205/31782_1 /TAXON_ID=242541 /ORGANISM="Mayorella sp, Strain BSH-02190019" /LENGTH=434 /DNA_ID=CAMNT_0015323001 /DNA_START=22 /DNA_END=1324 /DNA_ORIENTATION=+
MAETISRGASGAWGLIPWWLREPQLLRLFLSDVVSLAVTLPHLFWPAPFVNVFGWPFRFQLVSFLELLFFTLIGTPLFLIHILGFSLPIICWVFERLPLNRITVIPPPPPTRPTSSSSGKLVCFHVTSILTSTAAARHDQQTLSSLFREPFTTFQMGSMGFIVDMVMVMFSRKLRTAFPPPLALSNRLEAALNDPKVERVFVSAHGYGAVLLSACLQRFIVSFNPDLLEKLVVFTFGSASVDLHENRVVVHNRTVPTIESLYNRGDLVARMGIHMVQDSYPAETVHQSQRAGHLLQTCYLHSHFTFLRKRAKELLAVGTGATDAPAPYQVQNVEIISSPRKRLTPLTARRPRKPKNVPMSGVIPPHDISVSVPSFPSPSLGTRSRSGDREADQVSSRPVAFPSPLAQSAGPRMPMFDPKTALAGLRKTPSKKDS